MKKIGFVIFLPSFVLGFSLSAFAQSGFGLPTGFDLKTFNKNDETAVWFLHVDTAVQEVVKFDPSAAGKNFAVYQDKKGWKVVAGTTDTTGFRDDAVFYLVDQKRTVTVATKKYDTALVASMGRALWNTDKRLKKQTITVASGWIKYVRQNADQTLTVWAFARPEDNEEIIYGPELIWYYNATGTHMNANKLLSKPTVTAVKAGNVLTVSCPNDRMPTIGTIWLAHRYAATSPGFTVTYKTGASTLRYNPVEKTYSWEHVGL